jgi:hypothetical protein
MNVLGSSIARLMFMVLTVAIGLIAMKSQAEFWLGVLAAITASWLLLAIGSLGARRGQRPFWVAFLIVASASLAFGFGPWSDVSIRGSYGDWKGLQTYLSKVLPTTKLFLRLGQYVKPYPRAAILTYDQRAEPVSRIELAARPDRAGHLEQLVGDLDRSVNEHIAFFSSFRRDAPSRSVVEFVTVGTYLDAAYLLASLLLGGMVGSVATLVQSGRGQRNQREPRTAGFESV